MSPTLTTLGDVTDTLDHRTGDPTPDETGVLGPESAYAALAGLATQLASPARLRLVALLAQGPHSVGELADEIGASVANTSHHLRRLAAGGLVTAERDGARMLYRLRDPALGALWTSLLDAGRYLCEPVAAVYAQLASERRDLPSLGRAALAQRLTDDDAPVVLDVRPVEEWRAGHIPGAVWADPAELADLDRLTARLPSGTTIVAYCRGPLCRHADEAVRRLLAVGRDAARLEGGLIEWRAEGRPVESSP